MAKKNTGHTGFRNGNLFCFHCGESYNMNLPQPFDMATAMMKTFVKTHKTCEKTWIEPVPTPHMENTPHAIITNAKWWVKNGEHGTSSKTMYNCLYMGPDKLPNDRPSHPQDPDDFRRCYLLLQAVPQWKNDLQKLKSLSPVWDKLVDHWDKLTELLEDQLKNKKANGMYELMKSLGC